MPGGRRDYWLTVRKFRARFGGETPDAMAALGYDSAMVLAAAIRRAGTTEGARVRDEIAATKDYPGVTGVTTIDAELGPQAVGEPAHSAQVFGIGGGEAVATMTYYGEFSYRSYLSHLGSLPAHNFSHCGRCNGGIPTSNRLPHGHECNPFRRHVGTLSGLSPHGP